MKIQKVHVFNGQEVLEGLYDIYIEDHKISKICVHDPLSVSYGCEEETLNANGRWLLPGLIDLHVHLTWNGKEDPAADIAHSTREENMLETVSNALKYLKHGITSVRDLGSPDDDALHVGKAVEKGKFDGPRIFAAGMSLIMTGGHDPFHGLPVDGPWEALKGVRTQVKKGAGVIKISATGGVYGRESGESVDDTELRQEELDMIIDEAHRRKVPVTAHAIGENGIRACLKAGIDCIEHGHFIQPDMARQMAEHGTALVPTLYVYRNLAKNPDIPEYAREKSLEVIEQHSKAANCAYCEGVLIGSGSDAGSPNTPHPSLLEEILSMEQVGISRIDALRAATSNAAEILGMKGKLGVVSEDAFADLLIADDDPTENLQVLRKPFAVIADGKVVSL
ncbi:MAG: amidohydrolase family protein [Dorea sp.]|nr:amidohydrolase family protein [Dorea sp.]